MVVRSEPERGAGANPSGGAPRWLGITRRSLVAICVALVLIGVVGLSAWVAHETVVDRGPLEDERSSFWVRSRLEPAKDGRRELNVAPEEILVRIDEGTRPIGWMYVGSKITTSVEEGTWAQEVSGSIGYVIPVTHTSWFGLRSEVFLESASFRFTGEFEDPPDGSRLWRLEECGPDEEVMRAKIERSR